jgi:RNA polymerase I-specific transcription initiation factor RRN7
VQRFQQLLGFDFTFALSWKKSSRKILKLPECQLLALIVVVTKLYFPFDGLRRFPTTASEPATQVIDWRLWAKAQKTHGERSSYDGGLGRGQEIRVKDSDVFRLTAQQIDGYMDWYEKSWLDNRGTAIKPLHFLSFH